MSTRIIEEEITIGNIPERIKLLKRPSEFPVRLIVEEIPRFSAIEKRKKSSRKKTLVKENRPTLEAKPTLEADLNEAFQAILNFTPVKRKRPVIEVLREIRDLE